MAGIDVKSAYLIKRQYGTGWRWVGQIKYKDAGDKWRTIRRALVDEDGNPILTDADSKDSDGNKVQTTKNIRKAKKALKLWRESVQGKPMGGRMLVADYISSDLKGRTGSIQGSTMRKYREYAAIIGRSCLADVPMRELDTPKVRAWVQDMKRQGMAPATIKTAYNLLHKTCERALQNGDIASNPCVRGILREDAPRALTSEEVNATKPNALDVVGVRRANVLLDSASNGRMRVGARLALVCGLRAGECCALRWRDLDLDACTLRVNQAIGRADGGTYDKPPKTADSLREIPIPAVICSELTAWRAIQEADHARAAEEQEREVVPFPDCYIIGYADGSFVTPHALGNAWSRLARKGDSDGPLIGTRGRVCTFHDLRHTFASHAIANGADVRSVAALMGHKDASVTLRIYADALPDAKARAMDAVSSTLTLGSLWAGEDGATDGS